MEAVHWFQSTNGNYVLICNLEAVACNQEIINNGYKCKFLSISPTSLRLLHTVFTTGGRNAPSTPLWPRRRKHGNCKTPMAVWIYIYSYANCVTWITLMIYILVNLLCFFGFRPWISYKYLGFVPEFRTNIHEVGSHAILILPYHRLSS